jgi:outer membrane immunogenic protein
LILLSKLADHRSIERVMHFWIGKLRPHDPEWRRIQRFSAASSGLARPKTAATRQSTELRQSVAFRNKYIVLNILGRDWSLEFCRQTIDRGCGVGVTDSANLPLYAASIVISIKRIGAMKQILVGGAVAVAMLSASNALAADLAARPYTKAPVVAAIVYDWTGFYIGGNAGYSWGRANTDGNLSGTQNVSIFRTAGPNLISSTNTVLATAPLTGRADVNGFIGGAQVGYNWQRGSWLFGLEADIQGSDERGSADVCLVAGCAIGTGILTANYKLDWFGTVRGRIGFLPTERLLLYATGGLAYGELSATAPLVPLSWGSTRAGWTVGAGAEAALDRNWSVKLEYLYMDLGNVGSSGATATTAVNQLNTPQQGFNTITTTTLTSAFRTKFTDNIVRVGVNYRFGGPVVARY